MTKFEELADCDSTWNKVGGDEPVFILRAQDLLAPEIVRNWADVAQAQDVSRGKVTEAFALAERMEEWAEEHRNTAKLPD